MVHCPWCPELTGFGLSFMFSLCMSLGFYCCWVFLGGSFPPAGLLRATRSSILFCRCGQVVLKLVLLSVQGLGASSSLSFSYLFSVISPSFSCISRSVLGSVSVASTSSFTFFHFYLLVVPLLVGFPFQQV